MLSLYLIAAIAGVGALLYLEHRSYLRRKAAEEDTEKPVETPEESAGTEADNEECCGMHITCERDSLLAAVSEKIEYYDDEELDRQPESYSDDEIEEFRDILITMRPEDIAGWARSLQLRNIALPQAVRDELIMIVAEARSAAVHNA